MKKVYFSREKSKKNIPGKDISFPGEDISFPGKDVFGGGDTCFGLRGGSGKSHHGCYVSY